MPRRWLGSDMRVRWDGRGLVSARLHIIRESWRIGRSRFLLDSGCDCSGYDGVIKWCRHDGRELGSAEWCVGRRRFLLRSACYWSGYYGVINGTGIMK